MHRNCYKHEDFKGTGSEWETCSAFMPSYNSEAYMFVFKNVHNLSYGGNGKILLKTILTVTLKSFRPICYFNMQNKLSVDLI